ncbi:hypothetical protein AAY473_021869 [Plecturocebus cupreus]
MSSVDMGFPYDDQAGLELLGSRDPPAFAFQRAGIISGSLENLLKYSRISINCPEWADLPNRVGGKYLNQLPSPNAKHTSGYVVAVVGCSQGVKKLGRYKERKLMDQGKLSDQHADLTPMEEREGAGFGRVRALDHSAYLTCGELQNKDGPVEEPYVEQKWQGPRIHAMFNHFLQKAWPQLQSWSRSRGAAVAGFWGAGEAQLP